MEIFKVVSLGLIGMFIYMLFKDRRDVIAVLISLVTGTIIVIFVLDKIFSVFSFMQEISNKANIDTAYINIVFKIIGIAFVTSFGSEICKDAEASNIAHKIELSGKVMILVLAIPILMSLLESILKIM